MTKRQKSVSADDSQRIIPKRSPFEREYPKLHKFYFNSRCERQPGETEVKWQYLLGIATALVAGHVAVHALQGGFLFFQHVFFSGNDVEQFPAAFVGWATV